jgi:hypothetical protein
MKYLSVVLGVMISSACSGEATESAGSADPEVTGDTGAPGDPAAGETEFRFQMMQIDASGHGCGHDHGHGDGGPGSPRVRRALGKGAARLAALQADTTGDNAGNGLVDTDPDDGGWDFTLPRDATAHTAKASPPNLYGNIGLAAWAAVESGSAGNRSLVAALDAGTAMQGNPDIDSPPDFVFGVALAGLAENPGFAQIAREHYDAKKAANGGAAGLGALIRDTRHNSREDGLIPYDVGWLLLGAAALDSAFPGAGYDADADLYAGLVVDDLRSATPRFDFRDTSEAFYTTGLAWAQVSAAWLDSRVLFGQLRAQLLDQQKPNGAWGTNAAAPADDLQSTAHAVQTLAITDRATVRSRLAERRADNFLLRAQAANGGWPDVSGIELPLVDADIMIGLALSRTNVDPDDLVPGIPLVATLAAPRWAQPLQ